MNKASEAMKQAQAHMRGLSYKNDAITSSLELLHVAENPDIYGEPENLSDRLRGRAAYLRDMGEVKSPELMDAAANALDQQTRGKK